MKNFNLDHLEKKTPYKTPENFFEEMQGNVLKEISPKQQHQPRIFKLNFSVITSLAAALAIVFGFTFLWKTNQTEITKPVEITKNTIKINNVKSTENSLAKVDVATISEIQKTVESIEKTNSEKQTKNSTSVAKSTDKNEESYNQLLNALSEEELAELSNNSDHDIYLELYN